VAAPPSGSRSLGSGSLPGDVVSGSGTLKTSRIFLGVFVFFPLHFSSLMSIGDILGTLYSAPEWYRRTLRDIKCSWTQKTAMVQEIALLLKPF
jgi:hypothetical protein